jgi:nucleotide-binding universal stress UspA family protein
MIAVQNILVATDFSETSTAALRYGRELAERFNATLHVLHVAERIDVTTFGAEAYTVSAPDLQQDVVEAARQRLHDMLTEAAGGSRVEPIVVTATAPAFAIIDYARDHKIDLIVIGTHGRTALAHYLIGSVAESVVRSAPCPVLTVRPFEREFVQPDTVAAAPMAKATR